MFFTHVRELFGDVLLKPVVRPLRWSNMATMPALPETQESIKEEIRRQVSPVVKYKRYISILKDWGFLCEKSSLFYFLAIEISFLICVLM